MQPQNRKLPKSLTRLINVAAHRLAADHEHVLVQELRQQARRMLDGGATPAEVAHQLIIVRSPVRVWEGPPYTARVSSLKAANPFLLPAILSQVMSQVSAALIGSPAPLEKIISHNLCGTKSLIQAHIIEFTFPTRHQLPPYRSSCEKPAFTHPPTFRTA